MWYLPRRGRLWSVIGIVVGAIGLGMALIGVCGLFAPSGCPTVPLDPEEHFVLPANLYDNIRSSIEPFLIVPDSYEYRGATARADDSQYRRDVSKYYTKMTVEFKAKNLFGVEPTHYAQVWLFETEDGECVVLDVAISQ